MALTASMWRLWAFSFLSIALAASGGCLDDGTGVSNIDPDVADPFTSPGWTIQIVDPASGAGSQNSLAYDASGNPAISYSGLAGDLRFARWNGAGWNLQTVVSSGTVGSSLAFDNSGMPTIAFIRTAQGGSLRFARWNGSSWSIEQIDDKGTSSRCSLVYDSLGQPAIAYRGDGKPGQLKFARRVGSTWTKEIVDSACRPNYISLAIDPAGNPAIAYMHAGPTSISDLDTLKFGRKSGSSWSIEVLDSGFAGCGHAAALAFDPASGYPAISHGWSNFTPATPGKRFVSWNGSAWVSEIINTTDSNSGTGGGSLAYDAAGAPVVGFRLHLGLDQIVIQFARRNGGVWQIEDVDSLGLSGNPHDTSTRVQGNPAIAYRGNGVLRYARRDSP